MSALFRQAWLSWSRARATALLAIIAFAVGIGSTTAIYTVVRSVLLAPVPYPDGDRFVAVYGGRTTEPDSYSAHSIPDALEYERAASFDLFGFYRMHALNLTSPGEPRHVNVLMVTPPLVHGLGISPAAGQWFTDETGAVISDALWRRLGADRGIVGQGLTLDGRRLTITGVMPSAFRLPMPGPAASEFDTEVWIHLDPSGRGQPQDSGLFFIYARRKPNVSLAQAEAEVQRIAQDVVKRAPASHPSYTAKLEDLRDTGTRAIRPLLLLLFAAAGLLLLVTCANVAALLLARSVARARETAIRVALGARQRQLALHYFVEGLPISIAGAAGGVIASVVLVRFVLGIAAGYIPRADEVRVDWTVFAFALAMAVLTSALCSLAPLWQALRIAPNDALSAGVRASASARARRLSQALVVAEVALAFTLLAVSAVLITHMRNLTTVHPGFNPDRLLTFDLTMPEALTKDEEVRVPFQRRLIEAIEAVPGVEAAAFANQLPLDGCCMSGTIVADGRPADQEQGRRVSFVIATPGFVRTMQIPLVSGRLLDERDAIKDLLLIVVNQAAAERYWPGRSAVDATGRFNTPDGTPFRVVGVVGDIRNLGLGKNAEAEAYLLNAVTVVNPMAFLVRSSLPSNTLIGEVRRAVHSVDPTLPIQAPKMMTAIVHESLSLERVASFVMTFFALAALLMATLGVYGVIAYGVRQRTVEIGTRMALGATGRDVVALVLRGGLLMAAIGIAIGAVAVIAATGTVARFFGTADVGPAPYLWSTAVIVAIAGLASSLPAWRATLLSPTMAIRDDAPSTWQSARRRLERTMREIAHAVTGPAETPAVSEGALLAEFVAAARRADSFGAAIRMALVTLRNALAAESVLLLEKTADDEYRTSPASPDVTDLRLPAHGYLLNRLRASEFPLSIGVGELDALTHWAGAHRPGRVAEFEALKAAGARLAMPLRTKREILGVLVLGPPAGREEFARVEVEALRACAGQFALMIENARLTGRVLAQEKLRRDVALAAEVQRRLLPEQAPDLATAVLAGTSLAARTVGGDYYDFVELGEGRIGIALADVAGKGVPAALIMSVVQASLRVITAESGIAPADLAERMNGFLHRSTASNSYATFFFARFDERTRQLHYVNAGHNPPFLLRAGGDIEELPAGGTPIGLLPGMTYQDATLALAPGDVLLAFTDGVVEAHNRGDEEYGDERLKALLRRTGARPVPEISAAILADLKAWIRDADQYDDLTFILLKVN